MRFVQILIISRAFTHTNLTVIKTLQDPNGRFIICDIKAGGKFSTLANIYAPNKDDPNFLDSFLIGSLVSSAMM